jgi:hypothetical protein
MKQLARALWNGELSEIVTLGFEYNWPVSASAWSRLGTGFKPYGYATPLECNQALKRHVAARWQHAEHHEKLRLAQWIVSDWGGIRGNAPNTIERHAQLADMQDPPTPIDGVASYSKVLAFTKPARFAIYDARVAACLNALQIACVPSDTRLYFTHLAGRNTKIEAFKKRFRATHPRADGFRRAPRSEIYQHYLTLLAELSDLSGEPIEIFEMAFFSEAERICTPSLQPPEPPPEES